MELIGFIWVINKWTSWIKKIPSETFNKILNVCPGVIVEGLPKEQVDTKAKHDLVWGYYLSLFYVWSTDEKIRFESSTGGLLNGLSLYLLDSRKVKFILHTVTHPEKPMRSVSKLSYNREELLNSNSCSRYGPASPLDKFYEALNLNQQFTLPILYGNINLNDAIIAVSYTHLRAHET